MREIFQFKQFELHQSNSAMPVTTDACILGAMADFSGCTRVLDIGTGTGVLSLMLAQRFPELQITGVEKDRESYMEAQKNFTLSKWLDRLYAKNADIIGLEFVEQFDGVICNPPFFEEQLASQDERKSAARHAAELNYESLAVLLKKHLSEEGRAWVILPVLHEEKFRKELSAQGFFVKRNIRVHATAQKAAHLVILHIVQKQEAESTEEFITYDTQGFLTKEAQNLLRDFYLHLP